MITFVKSDGRRHNVIQPGDPLPDPTRWRDKYVDHETRSGDPKRGGDDPWHGDRIAGTAFTYDDCPDAFYVPVRHTSYVGSSCGNYDLEKYRLWLRDVMTAPGRWINHNIQFDAHFSAADGAPFGDDVQLHDTLTLSKLVDSDRGFGGHGYGLDALSFDWLGEDIALVDQRVQAYLKGAKTKDYADCPADMMGDYACQDVITNRRLFKHITDFRSQVNDPGYDRIWDMEVKLTPVFWDMANEGLRLDMQRIKVEELLAITNEMRWEQELHELTGFAVNPNSSPDMYELVVNRLGLPVLSWQDDDDRDGDVEHTPCFDYDALVMYSLYPDVIASRELSRVFDLLIKYRDIATFHSLFLKGAQRCQANGWLHPQYTQLIRTGRTACKKINIQQLDSRGKRCILPDDDDSEFLSEDGSQIEFRLIAHYVNEPAVIEAYRQDPDTDFHKWVASMVFNMPIESVAKKQRDPAKTINFAAAYGAGRKKIVSSLSSNMLLVGELGETVKRLIDEGKIESGQRREAFTALAAQRANDVYDTYHAKLPGLKRVSRMAANYIKQTGYVFNAMGRRRNLPVKAAFRAFNSITQGMGSDVVKWAMMLLSPRYCQFTRERGIRIAANVHDELLFCGPREVMRDPETHQFLRGQSEATPVPLRVPIRFDVKQAPGSWYHASCDEAKLARAC